MFCFPPILLPPGKKGPGPPPPVVALPLGDPTPGGARPPRAPPLGAAPGGAKKKFLSFGPSARPGVFFSRPKKRFPPRARVGLSAPPVGKKKFFFFPPSPKDRLVLKKRSLPPPAPPPPPAPRVGGWFLFVPPGPPITNLFSRGPPRGSPPRPPRGGPPTHIVAKS